MNSRRQQNTELVGQFDKVVTTAKNLQSNVDGRLLWLELLKAIDAALPKDTRPADKRQETEEDIAKREEIHIEGIECEFLPDMASWQAERSEVLHAAAEAGRTCCAARRRRLRPLKTAPRPPRARRLTPVQLRPPHRRLINQPTPAAPATDPNCRPTC